MLTDKVILPIVHSNGTSAKELIKLRRKAYGAVHEALLKLNDMAPHGRDYYPEPGLYEKAQAQHRARLAALHSVYTSLEVELVELVDETNS